MTGERALMFAFLAFAALAKLARYLPASGLAVFAACFAVAAFASWRWARNWLFAASSESNALGGVVGTLLALTLIFLVGYPLLETYAAGRADVGSDRDEALEAAVRALMSGASPYDVELSTGNPLSPLPGELLLAAPFVLSGFGGLQNIAWLGFYYCALRFELESAKAAALALWGTVLLAPGVVHEIVTAGDLLATSLYAAVGLSVLVLVAKRRVAGHGLPFGVGLLVGMSLSSRLTYLLLVPLVCSALMRLRGLRYGVVALIAICIGFLGVTLPFALTVRSFDPLHVFGKVSTVSGLAHAPAIVCVVAGMHVLFAVRRIYQDGATKLLPHAASVLMTPVLISIVVSLPKAGTRAIQAFGWYALWCVPFATAALARDLLGSSRRPSSVTD